MSEILLQLLEQHGPWVALACFLIWSQRKDYRGVCNRLNEVEDYCKTTLTDLVKETTAALEMTSELLEKCQTKDSKK